MSNNKTPTVSAVSPPVAITQQIAAINAPVNAARTAAINNAVWPTGQLRGSLRRYQLYDYAFQPTHPQGWTSAVSRDLEEADMFEAQSWLRQMAGGAYDTVTHYTPALRLLAYFERPQDAAMFKLVWS